MTRHPMYAKRPTHYCDTCESTVYSDDVHSCYDAKAVREQQERERALNATERAEFAQMRQTIMDQGAEIAALRPVAEAAAAWEFSFRDPADPWGYTVDERHDELLTAVRAWREGQG